MLQALLHALAWHPLGLPQLDPGPAHPLLLLQKALQLQKAPQLQLQSSFLQVTYKPQPSRMTRV